MKTIIILFVALFYSGISLEAQITLAHSYGPVNAQSEIVNLSLSGKKIMVVNPQYSHHDTVLGTTYYPDTINFYNLDFSFWKRIICPIIPGFYLDAGYVYYPSETLFNTDTYLEVAVGYFINTAPFIGKILVINEIGAIVDSMPNVSINTNAFNLYNRCFRVYEVDTLGIGFQAVVSSPTGTNIYNLPGTLPCNTCSGNGLGVAKVEKTNNGIPTQPLPNPSSSQVKITFTLPEGVNNANLVLYNNTGQEIRSFIVDNRFGYILLDNSQLSSGVYYYNIEANGIISSTQKMVVIK